LTGAEKIGEVRKVSMRILQIVKYSSVLCGVIGFDALTDNRHYRA